MPTYIWCDICEKELEEQKPYCDDCSLGLRDMAERAKTVFEHLLRRVRDLEDKVEANHRNEE